MSQVRILFNVLLMGCTMALKAQTPLYAVVTESMLASTESYRITDMALDTNGLVWVTTEQSGILRYDGERFMRMDKAPDNVDDEIYYTAIAMIRPKFWLAAGNGVYAWKGREWIKTTFPESHCIDLINTGMGRIYALGTSTLYYRGVSDDQWIKEEVPGLEGAYQLIQKEGLLLIASESGLWLRNPAGLWTQLLDEPVSSAMPLGAEWLAVTRQGLKRLANGGWVLIAPDVKGYHSYVTTADGQNAWLIGESGLWYVRNDGAALRLYSQGGLELETLQHGMASDAGGLLLASEKDLLRVDQPERWFDLRTLPYRLGPVQHVSGMGADSCWLATSKGLYALGPMGLHALPKPGAGVIAGVSIQHGGYAFGEFGLRRFSRGTWKQALSDQWVSGLAWKGDSLLVQTLNGWNYLAVDGHLQPYSGQLAIPTADDDLRWVKDVFGLALEADARKVGERLKPALLIRGVERRTKKENDPVVVKFGFRGLPSSGDGIAVEYQINGGEWVNLGTARRLVLDRLRAGTYTIRLRAIAPNAQAWGMPAYHIEVLPAAWKRPEYWMPAAALGLLLLGVAGYIGWRRLRDRRVWQKERAQLERMALRLQMNPHFTFNALESISAFVLEKKPKEAVTYLHKFSRLMRYTLENAEEAYVTLEKEKQALENYIALEQMRFDHGFQCVFQVEEGLDTQVVGIPPMLVQPLVENAILHGLRPKLKAGATDAVLKIYMGHGSIPDSLLIHVEDNGVGREASKHHRSGDEGEKRSAATRILQSRLQALQQETGKPHSVVVEDLDEGTRVSLVLAMHQEWSEND
jgi:hypothetical protein